MKIAGRILVALTVLLLAMAIALQVPAVQTAITSKALDRITGGFDCDIQVGEVVLHPFNTLIIKDVLLLDDEPFSNGVCPPQDTVFSAGTVIARFTLRGLLSDKGIQLSRAEVHDGFFGLVSEPGESKSNIERIFRIKSKEKTQNEKDIFSIRRFIIDGFTYRMHLCRKEVLVERPFGIDWNDLELTADAEGRNLKFSKGIMSGVVDHLSFTEKSGFEAKEVSGEAAVGNGLVDIQKLHIQDQSSDIHLTHFKMFLEDSKSFSRFLSEVRMDGVFEPSTLSIKTLSYFVPALQGNVCVADIKSGSVNGPVNDLNIEGLVLTETGSGIKLDADARLSGLPDIKQLVLDCSVNELLFDGDGVDRLLADFIKNSSLDISSIIGDDAMHFTGHAKGPITHFDVDGRLASASGNISTDICIKNLLTDRDLDIHGNAATEDLDLGKFIGQDFVHELSVKTGLNAVMSDSGMKLSLDSLVVDRLNLLGYDYSNIRAAGTYSGNEFDGRIVCNDPNLNFMFQGLVNLSRRTDNANYRFFASLGYADLHALKIDSREMSRVSVGNIIANYTRIKRGELRGSVDVSDIVLEGGTGRHNIGDMHLSSRNAGNRNSIGISSSFAEGEYNGSKSITAFIKDIQEITTKREVPALYEGRAKAWSGDTYNINLDFHDSRDLLAFIAPGAYIADSSSVRLRIDRQGSLNGSISSQRIAFKDKYLKNASLMVNNNDGALNASLTSDEISVSKQIKLKNDAIIMYADDNSIGLGINYNNLTDLENRGEFYITGDLSSSRPGSPVVNARTLTSNLYYNGEQWRFSPTGFKYADKGFKVDDLNISKGNQNISIRGGISPEQKDTLSVNIAEFDLSLLNALLADKLDIYGNASGRMILTSPTKDNIGLMVNLTSNGTAINGHDAGTFRIGSNWDDEEGRLNLVLRNDIRGRSTIDAKGGFKPKDKNLSLSAKLDGLELGYAAELLSSVFDRMEGLISGEIEANGTLDHLDIKGKGLKLKDGQLTVGFTKVPYFVNGPLSLDNYGVHFDDMAIRDRFSGTGVLSGGIAYDHFKNIRMDTHIRMDDIECLNTTSSDNPSFYGNVSGSGRMGITGPFNALLLDIDASTVRNGRFCIPLGASGTITSNELLTFKEPVHPVYIDPYEQMMNMLQETTTESSDMVVKLRVNAHPGVEAALTMDGSTQVAMNGNGSGTISLEVRPSTDLFTINGDYTLNSGNCRVSAFGITTKDFAILDGSSIKFNGDIMESDLDLKANYQVKTSLSTLLSDDTSVGTRRNVDCGLSISDKLKNPKLDFSIDIPDLNPSTKSQVESALSTDDKIQKQFVALLVTNNFLPDEQSGVVNNTGMLYSNVADIMMNQVNSILQKLDIPVDLDLNYQSSQTGTSIFDVALSTQLFNNRVVVNGNIGNRQYMATNEEGVVGDIDIEIKMDKSGQVRLDLFSHSADQYTNYLDNSQRNGVGVTYQKEFNTLKEFFQRMFSTKEERDRMDIEQKLQEKEKVTINIE